MYRSNILIASILAAAMLLQTGCSQDASDEGLLPFTAKPGRSNDFSLWQLAQFNKEVQMGYIIRSDDGTITVIDGGGVSAAPALQSYINQLGGVVHHWLVTHAHPDHYGALLEIIRERKISINTIVYSPLQTDWVQVHEADSYQEALTYHQLLQQSGIALLDPDRGVNLSLGEGVGLEVLGIRNPHIHKNAINNSSLVFKVSSAAKSVLFLGDLGPEGGQELLRNATAALLKSDYVQMAHHGQRGVGLEVYQAVAPRYALWPTPDWLYDNNLNGKVNSGQWKSLEVRSWMEQLNVERNYVAGLEGTQQID